MKHKRIKIKSDKEKKRYGISPSPVFRLKYRTSRNLRTTLKKLCLTRSTCHNIFEVTDSRPSPDLIYLQEENSIMSESENMEMQNPRPNKFNHSEKCDMLKIPSAPKKGKTQKLKCPKIQNNKPDFNVKPSIVKMSKDDDDEVLRAYAANKKINLTVSNLNCLISDGEVIPRLVENDISQQRSFSSGSLVQNKFNDTHEWVGSSDEETIKISKKHNILKKTLLRRCCITVNSADLKKTTTVKMYELKNSRILVITKPESYFYLIGVLELELIKGSVEVLGYILNKPKERLLIFSLHGTSHLFIKTKSDACTGEDSTSVTTEILISLGLTEKMSRKILREAETSALFIMTRKNTLKSSTVWPAWFENHLSFCIFPQKDLLNLETRPCHSIEKKTGCLFEANIHTLGLKAFKELPEWSEIEISLDIISQDFPKIVLCGGKSVGKSTLLRYIINKCLQKWNRALVIDFDPGQCEFTVAGCISATMVEEPVVGPNYSHLKEPLRSVFLGEVDVTKCPESYIEGCKLLINYAKQEHNNIPWLINTMGFTRGIGVSLNCGIIKNVIPTHVIQIESKDRKLNFPARLDPGYVYSQNVGAFSTGNEPLNYQLFIMPSGSEYQGNSLVKSRGLSPPEARNLVILSYLSEMLSSEVTNLSQVIPYAVDMEHIELRTTEKYNLTKAEVAATMNGNMVALCRLMENNTFPNCHGFGIVRGIDWQAGTLYLITPLHNSALKNINCLVKGNVVLPESLYYNQGMVVGHIPYLAFTSGRPTTRFAKRDFRSVPVSQREEGRSEFKTVVM